MQQAIDEAGNIWEVDAQGNPVRFVGNANQQRGGVQVKPADPTRQYQGPQAQADLTGKQIGNRVDAATAPYAGPKAAAEARKATAEAAEAEMKLKAAQDAARNKAGKGATDALLGVIAQIDNIASDVQDNEGWGETGFTGARLRGWEGTAAYDIAQKLKTIDANLAFNELQKMRNNSPTGGALGQVTEKELDLLRSTVANLDPNQSQEEFLRALKRARDSYTGMLAQADPETAARLKAEYEKRQNDPLAGLSATVESGPPGSQGDGPVTPLWSDPGPSGGSGGGLESLITGTPQAQIDARNRDNVFGEIDSIGRNFANSATLGLADRVAAAGNAVLPVDNLFGAKNKSIWDGSSFGQAYDANMRLQERTNAADRLANPWTSAGGDIGGSIAGMMLANQMLAKLGASALVAKTGGVAGDVTYGTARGAVEDGPMGALTGGALAAAGGAAGRYVLGPAIGAVAASKPGQAVINTVGRGANAAANVGRGLIGRKSVPFRPTMLPAPVTGGERAALARVPDDVASQLSYAQNAGLPLALADTSPQLQALAGSVVRKSPDAYAMARDTLGARALGQADRAQEQIVRNFGPVANPNDISESLLQQARARSAPLYDAFRAQPARTSDELQVLMQTPAGRQALENARSIAANEGRDPNALGFDLDAQGNVILRSDPSPETLDLVKRGLDDVVGGYRNPVTGQLDLNDQGRAVEGLRQRFVSEVDRLYPNYAEARAAYAGPASERAALQQGRDLANANPRDIQVTMGRMTPGQQEQFRLGQRVAMSDAVDKVRYSSNPYQNIYGSPVAQERAATVFGRGPADEMRRAYETEQRMAQTAYDTLGGSPTAMRLAADEAFDSPLATAIDTGFTIATGGGAPSIGAKAANWIKDSYRLGASKKKADQLAPLLFETNPEKLATALKALKEKSVARDVYIKRARKVGGLFGAGLGISAASSGN